MVSNFTILVFLFENGNFRVDFFWSEKISKGFLCKYEGELNFYVKKGDFYFWSELFQISFKGVSHITLNVKHFESDFSHKI